MASGSSNAATAANAASGFGDHGTCIPASQREASFTIAALHQWEIGVDDPRCVEVAEEVNDHSSFIRWCDADRS